MWTALYLNERVLDRGPEARPSALVLWVVSILRVRVHVSEGPMKFLPPRVMNLTYRLASPPCLTSTTRIIYHSNMICGL